MERPASTASGPLNRRATLAGLGIATAGFLALGPVWRRVASLYVDALPPGPYFVPSEAVLLYVVLPFAVAGAVVMTIAPGFFLVVGGARRATLADAVIRGYLVAYPLLACLGLVAGRLGSPAVYTVGVPAVALAAWLWCARRGGRLEGPPRTNRARLAIGIGTVALATVLLLPVLFWQDVNPDGLELLTMARSLDSHIVPRLPTGDLAGLGLGMVASAYPVHGFYLIGGLLEAAVRLPVLVFLPVLLAGTVSVVEADREHRLGGPDVALVAASLLVIVAALAYNATYHAYSADIGSPASIDLLAMVGVLGMLGALVADRRSWFIGFTVLSYFARPIAVLVALLGIVGVLAFRRRAWRRSVITLALGIATCILLAVVYERLLAGSLGLRLEEPTSGVAGRRLRYLAFADWRRLWYVLAPIGVLPAVALLAGRRQDPWTRVFTLIAVGYLAAFWFPAFTALHQFLPVVLLTMVVFWRTGVGRPGLWRGTAMAALAVGLAMALPASFAVDRSYRALASEIDYRVGDYLGDYGDYREAFAAKNLLNRLFPDFSTVADPDTVLMGAGWAMVHYAATAPSPKPPPNYLVLPPGVSPEPGWTLVGEGQGGVVYVRDRYRWLDARRHPPPTDFRSPVLAAPRASLLPVWGVPAGRYDLDLRALIRGR